MITNFSAALAALLVAACFPFGLRADELVPRWPEGYVIAEKSESPDGRYGVLIPTKDSALYEDEDKIENTLVNLKTHRRLCVISGAHYFPGKNHYGLAAAWADDSNWCAVTYDGRYGFENITLVEPKGSTCTQTDIGKHILKSLSDCPGIAYFRSGPGRTILVRAIAYSDPKGMNPNHTDDPFFQGTFDLATRKWTRSESRRLPNIDAMRRACADTLDEHITFSSDEDRLQSYDELLNDVYSAVRMVLPPERFASVKKEQIAWLKKLESSDYAAKKCEFMAARIQELRRLVW